MASRKEIFSKTLYPTNDSGMVELMLTPEDMGALMESMAFSRQVMDSSLRKMAELQDLTEHEKSQMVELQIKTYAIGILYDRLLADITGEEQPTENNIN